MRKAGTYIVLVSKSLAAFARIFRVKDRSANARAFDAPKVSRKLSKYLQKKRSTRQLDSSPQEASPNTNYPV